jgi:hypothetical protein
LKTINHKIWVDTLLKVLTLFFCISWYSFQFVKSEIPADSGDGIMHYFISNASWENPILLLHHWGKPLFILLSSPFSQFGFSGIISFNILVFTVTILIAWKIASKFNLSIWLTILFPIILINIQDYSITVLGGLTEPLFNLFFLLTFWLLVTKKWFWLAIITSFLPFLRSEGQLPVVLIFFILLYFKQYKYIPFLLVGFILYSIVGFFALNDFWWYFTKSPYVMNNGIYQHGNWNHYLLSYKNYLGNTGLFVFIGAFIYLILQILKRSWKTIEFTNLFYIYGTFVGIVVLHSYFWATGQNASLGLTRITTQAMPAFVLLNLIFIEKSRFGKYKFSSFVIGSISLLIALNSVLTKHFPIKANALELQVINAANTLKRTIKPGQLLFYHHPLFCFEFGNNPFTKNQSCIFYYCDDLEKDIVTKMKAGDLIVRDSQFGPQEQQLTFQSITNSKHLTLYRKFVSKEQKEDTYSETEGVFVYEVK